MNSRSDNVWRCFLLHLWLSNNMQYQVEQWNSYLNYWVQPNLNTFNFNGYVPNLIIDVCIIIYITSILKILIIDHISCKIEWSMVKCIVTPWTLEDANHGRPKLNIMVLIYPEIVLDWIYIFTRIRYLRFLDQGILVEQCSLWRFYKIKKTLFKYTTINKKNLVLNTGIHVNRHKLGIGF